MINFNNTSEISLNQTEYCVLQGQQKYYNEYFKVSIPKLIRNVAYLNDPFNRNILVNASDCKPTIDSSLYLQDYITIRKSPQCSLSHKVVNEYGDVPSGTSVTCLCVNGNYRDMIIIDSV